jgi:hypothetical protein
MSEILAANESVTIHDLDQATVQKMFRDYAKKIGFLASRGEPLSAALKALYQHLYDHPNDPRAIRGFREAFRDWLKQHLEVSSRTYLATKYGYLVEGESPTSEGPKIERMQ